MASILSRCSLLAACLTMAVAPAMAQEGEAAATKPTSEAQPMPETVYVLMETTQGDITLALNHAKAPITVENFLAYTDKGFYDGTIFHRVISNFMIQGGGFTPDGDQKTTDKPIKNEWQNGLKNERGTIAMARTNNPDSATAQFFINVQDNPSLDMARPQTGGAAYAVFGKVVAGMETVDAIRKAPTTRRGGMTDWPVDDVVIKKVRRLTDEEAEAFETPTEDAAEAQSGAAG